jgi:hypothetical protein
MWRDIYYAKFGSQIWNLNKVCIKHTNSALSDRPSVFYQNMQRFVWWYSLHMKNSDFRRTNALFYIYCAVNMIDVLAVRHNYWQPKVVPVLAKKKIQWGGTTGVMHARCVFLPYMISALYLEFDSACPFSWFRSGAPGSFVFMCFGA